MMSSRIQKGFRKAVLPLLVGLSASAAAEANTGLDALQANEADNVHQYIDFNLVSRHDPFKREFINYTDNDGQVKRFNEKNLGIGYTRLYDTTTVFGADIRLGGSAGYYKNSYFKDSFYVAAVAEAAYQVSNDWEVASGMMMGGISGYKHLSDMTVTPAGQFYLRAEYDDTYSLKLGYLPALEIKGKQAPELITLQASIKF